MGQVVYDLRLDAALGGSQASIVVKHGDVRTRRLRVRIVNGGVPVALPEGTLAVLRGVKPDGTVVFNDCGVEGNVILHTLTPQTIAVVGAVECELTVYGPDMTVVTSPRFDVYVEARGYGDGVVESTDEFTALAAALVKVAGFEDAEAAREEAEGERIAGEELREEREAARIEAEDERVAAEQGRVTAEDDRDRAEDKRGADEQLRKQAEQKRVTAEGERVQLYDEVKETYESGGFDGAAATIAVESTETGTPGTNASVQNVGSASEAILRFVIPQGKEGTPGKNGDAATIEIVQTLTGEAGAQATIAEAPDSTAQARRYIVTVPRGASGKDFVIKGLYATYAELVAAHPVGNEGDAYAVGTANTNVTVYIWDVDARAWADIGSMQGPTGPGVPAGGAPGQALLKASSTDYDTAWKTLQPDNIDGLEDALASKLPIAGELEATGTVAVLGPLIGGTPLDITLNLQATQDGTPTPDAPVPIVGPDTVQVVRTGKNILTNTAPSLTDQGVTFTRNDDGSFTCNGTATTTATRVLAPQLALPPPGTKVVLSGGATGVSFTLSLRNPDGSYKSNMAAATTDTPVAFTVPALLKGEYVRPQIQVTAGRTVNNVTISPQLELGEVATPYTPYQGTTYPITLPRTLYGLPEATDSIDPTNEKIYLRTRRIVLDGSEAWGTNGRRFQSALATQTTNPEYGTDPNYTIGNQGAISSHYPITVQSVSNGADKSFALFYSNGNTFVGIFDSDFANTNELKNWLNANPVTLLYVLAVPETPSTAPVTIPALAGTNTVYMDAAGTVEIKASAGVQGVIDYLQAQITALQAQITGG